jgi:hypothetical protein
MIWFLFFGGGRPIGPLPPRALRCARPHPYRNTAAIAPHRQNKPARRAASVSVTPSLRCAAQGGGKQINQNSKNSAMTEYRI